MTFGLRTEKWCQEIFMYLAGFSKGDSQFQRSFQVIITCGKGEMVIRSWLLNTEAASEISGSVFELRSGSSQHEGNSTDFPILCNGTMKRNRSNLSHCVDLGKCCVLDGFIRLLNQFNPYTIRTWPGTSCTT
jgi:hypothetical protein